jgi:hypothetical protein
MEWLIVWGTAFVLALIAIFITGVLVERSTLRAWESFSGIKSPGVARNRVMGYVLSVTGYLVAPAIIGTAVGVIVDLRVSSYRQSSGRREEERQSPS